MVTCPNCQSKFNYTENTKRIPIEADLFEVGIHCPTCRYWIHSFVENVEIARLRNRFAQVPNKTSFDGLSLKSKIAKKHDELQQRYVHLKKSRVVNV